MADELNAEITGHLRAILDIVIADDHQDDYGIVGRAFDEHALTLIVSRVNDIDTFMHGVAQFLVLAFEVDGISGSAVRRIGQRMLDDFIESLEMHRTVEEVESLVRGLIDSIAAMDWSVGVPPGDPRRN